ncbi:sodium:proton antiporter [Actinotalea ferrariae CF5-4]|uniref:Sodium:proton antiporter n=1 Tax=Actinotalea ferrariae CF5-4 TaxID=948458 RepID=A0A021VUA2_9CELL|nr:Na+/H+ antiporter subunit E [Actinotalea ferrariae]EYR63625.1 sodium:proton antiporter [Actinotalea ferrariae CF5-4]
MSLHPRRRALRVRVWTALWLTIAWALLWGNFAVGTLVVGLLVGVVVVAVLPMPPMDFRGRVHVRPLLYLVVRFVGDLTVASVQVAVQALDPRRSPRSAVLAVPLRSHSDLYLTLTAVLTSLVPGSVIVEAHRVSGTLYVHVLDVATSGGVEEARRHVLDLEARILRALASDAELAEAGLSRDPRGVGS